jgi:hypothetical protein
MTRTIEEIRLDVLRLAVTSRPEAEALDWAAQAMHLVEHGPTIEEQAASDDGTAAIEAFSAALEATAEPPRETVAQAIKAGREDVYVPGPASPPPVSKRWTSARLELLAQAAVDEERRDWSAILTQLNQLPGPDVSLIQAKSKWFGELRPKLRAAIDKTAAPAPAPPAEEPAPAPAEPPQATPEPVVRQWCARWLPAQRLSDPITEAELARVDAERRRRGLTPFTRIKEIA